MSHDSEDTSPYLADVVYQLASLGGHVIYEVRQDRLTLADLQTMLGTVREVQAEIERAIQATPINSTRTPRHRCTCYSSDQLNLAPADGHIITCPLRRLGPE